MCFLEKANYLYRIEGGTSEVYDNYIKAIKLHYSADLIQDISNCLLYYFRKDILELFRPGGSLYHLLDNSGKIIITNNLPFDKTIEEAESFIETAIKEEDNVIIFILVSAYCQKGDHEKAKNFIDKMKKYNWDFEKSRKSDHVLWAQVCLANATNNFNDVIKFGEEFIKVYKRGRITFMSYICWDLANAYFRLNNMEKAKEWCNKGLTFEGQHKQLNKLYEKIKEKFERG